MTTLTMLRGIPASGKSTWAKQQIKTGNVARVNRDLLRAMLHDNTYIKKVTEKQVIAAEEAIVLQLLRSGINVIVDDTNLTVYHESSWRKIAAKAGAIFIVEQFDIETSEAIERDKTRDKPVGEKVITKHAQILEGFDQTKVLTFDRVERYMPNNQLPKAIIVDIDGTLALRNNRDIYDLSLVDTDLVNEPVAVLVRSMTTSCEIIFLTGRETRARQKTVEWLINNNLSTDPYLLMRKDGDMRRDSMVKIDLFNQHVRNNFNVMFALDDRQQVLHECWARLGVTAFDVANGAGTF